MTETRNSARLQEMVFSIFMALAAVLGGWDARLQQPNALMAGAALLLLHAVAHAWLKRRRSGWVVPATVAADVLLVSWIVAASGGGESYAWPLYLLPILSASLLLKPRASWWAVVAVTACLAWASRSGGPAGGDDLAAQWLVKAVVLALAGLVAGRVSFRERVQSRLLDRSRAQLARLASRADGGGGSLRGGADFAHELGNALTVVLGSAELLVLGLPEDAGHRDDALRIRDAALKCRDLLGALRSGLDVRKGGVG